MVFLVLSKVRAYEEIMQIQFNNKEKPVTFCCSVKLRHKETRLCSKNQLTRKLLKSLIGIMSKIQNISQFISQD